MYAKLVLLGPLVLLLMVLAVACESALTPISPAAATAPANAAALAVTATGAAALAHGAVNTAPQAPAVSSPLPGTVPAPPSTPSGTRVTQLSAGAARTPTSARLPAGVSAQPGIARSAATKTVTPVPAGAVEEPGIAPPAEAGGSTPQPAGASQPPGIAPSSGAGSPTPLPTSILLGSVNPVFPIRPRVECVTPASVPGNDIRNLVVAASPSGMDITADFTYRAPNATLYGLQRTGIVALALQNDGAQVPGTTSAAQPVCVGDGHVKVQIERKPGSDGNTYISTAILMCMIHSGQQPSQFYCERFRYRREWLPTPVAGASVTPPPANSLAPNVQRLNFARGAISARARGQVAPSAVDRWVIKAGAGQTMSVTQDGSQLTLAIAGSDGTVLLSRDAGAVSWSGVLPATQDYYVDVIGSTLGVESYSLTITIPPRGAAASGPGETVRRITFARGAISAAVRGSASAGADHWVIKAGAGQTMTVRLSPADGQVTLAVRGADGTVLISGSAGAASGQALLPRTQDYYIDVLPGSPAAAGYTLSVTIPPPPR